MRISDWSSDLCSSDLKASDGLEAAVGDTGVHMKDSFGWALQAGVDVPISERAFINFDVKYVDIDTTARLSTTAIGTQRVRVHQIGRASCRERVCQYG